MKFPIFSREYKMPEDFPQVFTIDEASHYLRIPLSSLYKLSQGGKIPCQKVGRHWRFRKEAIDRWLEEHSPSELKQNDGI
jgi:excisionase family DNA binding protein